MGLDMYLNRRTYIGGSYEHREVKADPIKINVGGKPYAFDPSKLDSITERVGYWRKANHIHKWFVDNTQDGEDRNGESDVSREQLKELLALCRKVKEVARLTTGQILVSTAWSGGEETKNYEEGQVIENVDEVEELLPTQAGFFFGSTEYDEYYLRDIDSTIEILEALDLDSNDWQVSYEYCASW